MKKQIVLKLTVLILTGLMGTFFPSGSMAQDSKIELTPFGGYMLGGSIKFYEGKFKIQNSACYGGNLAYRRSDASLIEISYTRMDTEGDWRPYSGYIADFPDTTIEIAINYLQIGAVNELVLDNDAVRPYATYGLGAAWLHPKVDGSEDEWMFAVNAGVGLKYFFSERIGIRLQARLLLPMVFGGAGFYFGFGAGGPSSGVGVSSYAPVVQGDFTGGLIIALGD